MKWTKEKCQEEALKYNSRNEFKNNNNTVYRISIKSLWLDDITKHMLKPFKIKLKWTKEKCQEEALKYQNKIDFTLKSRSAYNSALNNNWLDEICSHMIESTYKPKNYWNKEKCQEEALKYNFRNEFKKNNNTAYSAAINLGILDNICSHMKLKYKTKYYYTKELCKLEAEKYTNRTDFCKKSPSFYKNALKNKWLDDICNHMIKKGNLYNRCIYVYEFSDNYAYIGLTYNISNRNNRHLFKNTKSAVLNHIKKTNITPNLIQLTDYISINDAIILEDEFVKKYKNNGWILLNKNKTGGIGGNIIKWNKEKCQEEALKYSKRSHFAKNSPSAYSSSIKNNWLNEICNHMK